MRVVVPGLTHCAFFSLNFSATTCSCLFRHTFARPATCCLVTVRATACCQVVESNVFRVWALRFLCTARKPCARSDFSLLCAVHRRLKGIFTFPERDLLVVLHNADLALDANGKGCISVMQMPSDQHVAQAYHEHSAALGASPLVETYIPTLSKLHVRRHPAHHGAIADAHCVSCTRSTACGM